MNEKKLASITTEEGFRDRFKQEAENMRSTTKKIADIRPEILSDRLHEDYDLRDNPRVMEIRKKLGLS